MVDIAWRLGPRAVGLVAWHRLAGRRLAGLALADAPMPGELGLPAPRAPPPALPAAHRRTVMARAAALAAVDWHGPFAAGASSPALALDLFTPGDIRPVWEANRWAELPLLAQAARLEPAGGHAARAGARLAEWAAANPAFRGPNWACGQEAALRVLHLGLALALLGAAGAPPAGVRALLALHARRILATPAYAMAQDNNHPISEAAGLLACGLLLRDAALAARGDRRLAAAVRRLVAPDGGFAQLSTGYHRLLLDVLACTEWLRRQLGGPPAAAELLRRAAAATTWLYRLADPSSGAMPRLGHQDGSAFADLALAGPDDARPSLERAARLFAGASAGLAEEAGCAWLGLPLPAAPPSRSPQLPRPAHWRSAEAIGLEAASAYAPLPSPAAPPRPAHRRGADAMCLGAASASAPLPSPGALPRPAHRRGAEAMGLEAASAHAPLPSPGALPRPARWRSAEAMGWEVAGARALLRLGPPRFRPGHADLLHLDLWDGARNLLRDGGTGAYNPPLAANWWLGALAGVAGHNTVQFDAAEPMPRLGRFLLARWPRGGALADGGWVRDHRGNHHERRVSVAGRTWLVEDRVAGPFRHLALRWRLPPGDWTLCRQGVAGEAMRLLLRADAPLSLALEQGWESMRYGEVRPCPVLVARASAPVSCLESRILLP